MRFVGIDIGAERHSVAIVDDGGRVVSKSVSFEEGAAGYRRLGELLGSPADCLIAMEATGHYWKNLFVSLAAEGFQIVLLNPLRTRRFAEEELQRTKTDKVDAVSIARFAAQKRPTATTLHGPAIEELKQLVRLREQSVQHLGDRVRHLHKAIDLTFAEFTRHVRGLDTELATAILLRYPTAKALRTISVRKLAGLCYDGRRGIGDDLARALIEAAKISVGHFSSEPYQLQVRYACEDIVSLRTRVRGLETDIELRLNTHEVGKLLTTIPGVSTLTAARIIAETGDPARFRSAAAFASYIGAVPRLHQSGKKRYSGKPAIPLGNARLRRALWMPVLVGIRLNPWLRTYYLRLRAAGKRPKVAIIAAMHKLLIAIYSVAKHRTPFVLQLPATLT